MTKNETVFTSNDTKSRYYDLWIVHLRCVIKHFQPHTTTLK